MLLLGIDAGYEAAIFNAYTDVLVAGIEEQRTRVNDVPASEVGNTVTDVCCLVRG